MLVCRHQVREHPNEQLAQRRRADRRTSTNNDFETSVIGRFIQSEGGLHRIGASAVGASDLSRELRSEG